jgi:hypothetical protein
MRQPPAPVERAIELSFTDFMAREIVARCTGAKNQCSAAAGSGGKPQAAK